jgi:hypothetical protein
LTKIWLDLQEEGLPSGPESAASLLVEQTHTSNRVRKSLRPSRWLASRRDRE